VPFNQRLLSSTPAGTPTRKKLVERQGVLLLNGSTETQILNSTDTAAALQPPNQPCISAPCLSRGDVQFAAVPYQSSSSSSIPSSGGCDADVVPAAGATSYPLYSLASTSHSAPYRRTSVPCCTMVHSTTWQLPSNSLPVACTSLAPSHYRQPDVRAPPAASLVHPRSGGLCGDEFIAPQSAVGNFRHPVRARMFPTAPCFCSEPTTLTNVMSTAVTSDHPGPPVTLTASSSQETIEIHLERSPGRSKTQEQFTVVRGTTANRNRRRRPKSGTVKDRHVAVNTGRRPRCRSTADESDTERLTSLLRQLKVVVTANRNPEIARLLNEVCEAARTSPLLPSSQPANDDLSPTVKQLQSDITQLNRLECVFAVSFIRNLLFCIL